jgi:hypothetical protein
MSLWAQSDKSGPGSQRRALPNQPESDLRDRIRLPPLPRLGRWLPSFNSDSTAPGEIMVERMLAPASARRPSESARTANLVAL